MLAPAVINADKQFLNVKKVEILDWSFFLSWWAEDKNVLKVKYEVVEEIMSRFPCMNSAGKLSKRSIDCTHFFI